MSDKSPPVVVKLSDILDAYMFADASPAGEHRAYVCRSSGRIYCISDQVEMEEDLPEDVETSAQYVALPDKRDMRLGRDLALSFVAEELPEALDEAYEIFRRKGAYGRFKNLLLANDAREKWYAYEESATEAALLAWCEAEGFIVSESSAGPR